MTLRKVPGLRPGFPKGLEVLVVQSVTGGQDDVQAKLQELSYSVTLCTTCPAAVEALKQPSRTFDLVIAEAKCLGRKGGSQPDLLTAAAGLPIILTAEKAGCADDVWKGIELGAAEVLEKPLSSLKLQNIWQHVVRKMMQGRSTKSLATPMQSTDSKPATAPNSPRTPLSVGSALGSGTATSESMGTRDKGGRAAEREASASVGMHDSVESAPLPARTTRAATRKAAAAANNTGPPPTPSPAAATTTVNPPATSQTEALRPKPCAPASLPTSSWPSTQSPAIDPSCPTGTPGRGVGPPGGTVGMPAVHWSAGLFPHQTPHPVSGCAWGTPLGIAQSGTSACARFPQGSCGAPTGAVGVPTGGPVMAAAARHACVNAYTACQTPGAAGGMSAGHPSVPLVFPDGGKVEAHRTPPIGLNLRKSTSLLDLLNTHLPACA